MTGTPEKASEITESQKKMQQQLRILRQQNQLLTIELADVKNHEQQLKKLTKTLIDNFGDRVSQGSYNEQSVMNQVLRDIKIIIDGDSSWQKEKIKELQDKLQRLSKQKDDQVQTRVRRLYQQMVQKLNNSFNIINDKSIEFQGAVSSSVNQISVKNSKELEDKRNFPLVSFSASSQLQICLKCLQLDQRNHNLRKVQIKLNGELEGLKKQIHQLKKNQRQRDINAKITKQHSQNEDKQKLKAQVKALKSKSQSLQAQNRRLKEIARQYQVRNRSLTDYINQLQEQFIQAQNKWKEELQLMQEDFQKQVQRLQRYSTPKEIEKSQDNSLSMKREIQNLVKEIGYENSKQCKKFRKRIPSHKQNTVDVNSNSYHSMNEHFQQNFGEYSDYPAKSSYFGDKINSSKPRNSLLGNAVKQKNQNIKNQYCDFSIKDAINRPNRGLTFY